MYVEFYSRLKQYTCIYNTHARLYTIDKLQKNYPLKMQNKIQ